MLRMILKSSFPIIFFIFWNKKRSIFITDIKLKLSTESSTNTNYEKLIPNNLEGTLNVTARILFRPFDPDFILEHHP